MGKVVRKCGDSAPPRQIIAHQRDMSIPAHLVAPQENGLGRANPQFQEWRFVMQPMCQLRFNRLRIAIRTIQQGLVYFTMVTTITWLRKASGLDAYSHSSSTEAARNR